MPPAARVRCPWSLTAVYIGYHSIPGLGARQRHGFEISSKVILNFYLISAWPIWWPMSASACLYYSISMESPSWAGHPGRPTSSSPTRTSDRVFRSQDPWKCTSAADELAQGSPCFILAFRASLALVFDTGPHRGTCVGGKGETYFSAWPYHSRAT